MKEGWQAKETLAGFGKHASLSLPLVRPRRLRSKILHSTWSYRKRVFRSFLKGKKRAHAVSFSPNGVL